MVANVLKIFISATVAFAAGMLITPLWAKYLYSHQMWKKKAGKGVGVGGGATPIFDKLHEKKEVGTPRMGGVIIWGSVVLTTFVFAILAVVVPSDATTKINFLSRNQTWLPLFTLVVASLVGLLDDYMEIRGTGNYAAGGMSLKMRIAIVLLIGLVGGWWFYAKLDVVAVSLPFVGAVSIGWLTVPLFMLVMLVIYSGSVIDGIDGLSGGIMATIFAAYSGIAFFQDQIDLAAFCAAVAGATLAFLWFNIPPARFYMTETGMMGLTTSLAVVAFLTDSVTALPIVAFPLIATSLSDIIQLVSKRLRSGRKVFLVAPLHHHFEALGWPSYKVTMRYWVISVIFAIVGMVVALI